MQSIKLLRKMMFECSLAGTWPRVVAFLFLLDSQDGVCLFGDRIIRIFLIVLAAFHVDHRNVCRWLLDVLVPSTLRTPFAQGGLFRVELIIK